MTIVHDQAGIVVHHGDCLDVLRELPDASVDAVVTDPPYGLEFMGREWDAPWKAMGADQGAVIHDPATERGGFQDGNGGNPYSRSRIEYGRGGSASIGFQLWCELWVAECYRVLKPGGHLLAFGGTRMFHRLTCAVEDSGFEIRDAIAWLYGSGFPKSNDIAKRMDADAGMTDQRPVIRVGDHDVPDTRTTRLGFAKVSREQADGTEGAELWGRTRVTYTGAASANAKTWEGWGTALKPAFEPVVVGRKPMAGAVHRNVLEHGTGALNIDGCRIGDDGGHRLPADAVIVPQPAVNTYGDGLNGINSEAVPGLGRWPANVLLDESQAAELDAQTAEEFGGAARFFYTAKADNNERVRVDGTAHPTVKPISLMRWLVRLVTPPGGVVLEPFAGSGTTVEACLLEGFGCVAIEREADYVPLIVQRMNRRLDPVAAVRATGGDGGLFDLLDDEEVTA